VFVNNLCDGDRIEDVMDIKPFCDNCDNIRICSSILRTLESTRGQHPLYKNNQKKSYAFSVNEKMNSLPLKCLNATDRFNPRDFVNFDFDLQFIAPDKKYAKYPDKKQTVTSRRALLR